MKKSHYLVLIVSLIFFGVVPSSLAATGFAGAASEPAPITESDFGTAATGSGYNTTEYSINPNTAYDNMNIGQVNTTSVTGTPISDYYNYNNSADNSSAASHAGGNQPGNPSSKNIPIGRGKPDTSRGWPTPGAGLPSTMTGSLGNTLANDLTGTGKNALTIKQNKHYKTLGFTGSGLPSLYALNRGMALPPVSTGSIEMDTGFTPR